MTTIIIFFGLFILSQGFPTEENHQQNEDLRMIKKVIAVKILEKLKDRFDGVTTPSPEGINPITICPEGQIVIGPNGQCGYIEDAILRRLPKKKQKDDSSEESSSSGSSSSSEEDCNCDSSSSEESSSEEDCNCDSSSEEKSSSEEDCDCDSSSSEEKSSSEEDCDCDSSEEKSSSEEDCDCEESEESKESEEDCDCESEEESEESEEDCDCESEEESEEEDCDCESEEESGESLEVFIPPEKQALISKLIKFKIWAMMRWMKMNGYRGPVLRWMLQGMRKRNGLQLANKKKGKGQPMGVKPKPFGARQPIKKLPEKSVKGEKKPLKVKSHVEKPNTKPNINNNKKPKTEK